MATGIIDLPQFTWRPLPGLNQPAIVPSIQIAHTGVTAAASLFAYFNGRSSGVESHCYILPDGSAEQYCSAEMQADANGVANRWWDPVAKVYRGAFSCETWDNGNPEKTPWTVAQIGTLADIAIWLRDHYRMPLTVCTGITTPGIGWHSMWPTPNPWSPAGHSCPGSLRIAQFTSQLLPMIARKVALPIMACTPTLTEIENYVAKSYQAAGNADPGGQRYWVRTAGASNTPFAVFMEMDKALKLG